MKTSLIAMLLVLPVPVLAQEGPPAAAPTNASIRNPLIGGTIGLDHVLLWARDNTAAETYLRDKLGFVVSQPPGSYGAGIVNQLIRFENRSYIEFLWLSDPELARREAPQQYAFVTTHGGSDAFGIQIEDADETYASLRAAGFNPMNPGAEAYDPDGPSGPREPVVNQWRFMFLEDNSIPGVPFFVEYNFPPNGRRAAPEHPNGATRISSVWILVSDLAAARAAYRRAHFAEKESVTLPHLGAEGILLDAGEGEILLLAPHSTSPLAMQLQRRGDHVVGMSIEVSNLGAAEQLIEERLEQDLARHQGRFGTSFLVPSLEPLGVLLEFHE